MEHDEIAGRRSERSLVESILRQFSCIWREEAINGGLGVQYKTHLSDLLDFSPSQFYWFKVKIM